MSEENMDVLNEEDLDNIVYLSDEQGNEVAFEFIDLIEYQEDEYVVLLPVDEDSDEVVILKLEESDNEDEESFVSVDDDATLQAVFDIFKGKFADTFDFGE